MELFCLNNIYCSVFFSIILKKPMAEGAPYGDLV